MLKKEKKEIDVKEYIGEIDAYAISGDVMAKKTVTREKPSYSYKISVATGCDFVLSRTTAKTNKDLFCILSQNIFAIYDENKKTKKDITDIKILKSFFIDRNANDLVVEPGIVDYIPDGLRKMDLDVLFKLFTSGNLQGIHYLLKRNLINFNKLSATMMSYRFDSINTDINILYTKSTSLLTDIFKTFPEKNFDEIIPYVRTATAIFDMYGLDIAKYFVSQAKESSVVVNTNYFSMMKLEKYNLDGKRLIDYILFDSYRQGARNTNFIENYIDYLDQQVAYYGKVKEKYPKALNTEHQIISRKLREMEGLKGESPMFAEVMEESEDFSYQNPIDKFKIIMPTKSLDLVDEGRNLHHCVASYVKKVNNHDCLVVFMREKENPDTSYLTVEILPDRSVPQVEGMNKRHDLSDEEKVFLNRWAIKKNLRITAENAVLSKEELKELRKKEKEEAA